MPASAQRDTIDQVRPCLAELFRTCVHPAALTLKVERVTRSVQGEAIKERKEDKLSLDHDHKTNEHVHVQQRNCMILIVSDGHLQIQAVLATRLYATELSELRRGDILKLKKFQVRTSRRLNGKGRVAYLGVSSCEWIGREDTADLIEEEASAGGFFTENEVNHDPEDFQKTLYKAGTRTTPFTKPTTDHEVENFGGGFLLDDDQTDLDVDPAADTDAAVILKGTPRLARLTLDRKRPMMDLEQSATNTNNPKKRHQTTSVHRTSTPHHIRRPHSSTETSTDSSDEEFFETMIVSPSTIQKRREALQFRGTNTLTGKTPSKFQQDVPFAREDEAATPSSIPSSPSKKLDIRRKVQFDVNTISSSTNLHEPPPLTTQPHPPPAPTLPQPANPKPTPSQSPYHTLQSLSSPTLPRKNYTCTIFGIISWTSPSLIHQPNTPFPAKRHIKIHDLSIASRVSGFTLAVYIDAKRFQPKVGTVALFRGVTMQRWADEVILNAYVGLKVWDGVKGEEWYVDDDRVLREQGWDGDALRRWWDERRRKGAVGRGGGRIVSGVE